MRNFRRNVALAGVACALLLSLNAPAVAGEVRLRAQLFGTEVDPLASGHSDFRDRGTQLRHSTEVEDVASTDFVYIFANDQFVGFLPLFGGFGDLNLDSQDGDAVPVSAPGDVVTVWDVYTNNLVLWGVFEVDN